MIVSECISKIYEGVNGGSLYSVTGKIVGLYLVFDRLFSYSVKLC